MTPAAVRAKGNRCRNMLVPPLAGCDIVAPARSICLDSRWRHIGTYARLMSIVMHFECRTDGTVALDLDFHQVHRANVSPLLTRSKQYRGRSWFNRPAGRSQGMRFSMALLFGLAGAAGLLAAQGETKPGA